MRERGTEGEREMVEEEGEGESRRKRHTKRRTWRMGREGGEV